MFKTLIDRWNQHREYRQTYNALQKLNDRELKDIGLSRGMIKRTAMERADYPDANDNLKGWV